MSSVCNRLGPGLLLQSLYCFPVGDGCVSPYISVESLHGCVCFIVILCSQIEQLFGYFPCERSYPHTGKSARVYTLIAMPLPS